ncbi:three-Cys-motif partner protein TcmP [Achromobacter ruhlandii]|uniref:three-Cys-motif partner protein TcmP n=1 Tax=Achromobacter ruhlandii TaxID=72557 RepID=UPI003B9E0AB7
MKTDQILDPADGLGLMAVGAWAFEKHALIRRYVDASREARRKWSQRVLVDLYCGPGRVVNRERQDDIRDGGVLSAFVQSQSHGVPFTKVIIGDADGAAVAACRQRLERFGANVVPLIGPAHITVEHALLHLPANGLHLALLDPFNIGHLPFSVIDALAKRKHLDMIVHYSLMDVARNLELNYRRDAPAFDSFAPGWKDAIVVPTMTKAEARRKFGEYWQFLLQSLGYSVCDMRPVMTRPGTQSQLYQMVLLERHPLARHLWNEVARSPQGVLSFGAD